MKKTTNILFIFLLVILLTPSISFASWWNPFSWFEEEIKLETSMDISTSTSIVIPEVQTKSTWWNPLSWSKKEITIKQEIATTTEEIISENNNKDVELETAKAKAEAEKYKLEAEKTRLEIEKLKQKNTNQIQAEVKEEISKNATVTLPNGSIVEMDENGNIVKTIKEAEIKPSEVSTFTQTNYQTQQNSSSNQELESCLSRYYSRAEIQTTVDEIKKMYEDTSNQGIQRITSEYDVKISNEKSEGELKLTSAREAQSGFGTNTAQLNQIITDTEEAISVLENSKNQFISNIKIVLSQQLADLSLKQIELNRESEESMCY